MSTFENCQPETDASVENCQPKPVKCGCGGESKIYSWNEEDDGIQSIHYHAICMKCGIETNAYDTEAEAITAWNKAMGERTTKVEDIQVEWGDDEYVNDRMGDMYHYGNCGNCGETVSHNQKYCHECGARLEWDE